MVRGLAALFGVVVLGIFLAACGVDSEYGGYSAYGVDGAYDDGDLMSVVTEYLPEILVFERVDIDSVDFAALVMPTSVEHGEIGHWYIRHLSAYLPGRVPFTYRELDAALWLWQMLLAVGFNNEQVQVQTFSYDDVAQWYDYFGWGVTLRYSIEQGWHEGHETRNYSQNIIVTIPGRSAQTIIIGAHYDSLRYEGTSDNASGTALLMESAQRMLALDNYHTLVYVFFGAHEIGLLGAFYFYDSLTQEQRDNIVVYINADVLIEGPDLLISAGYGFYRSRPLRQNDTSARLLEITTTFSYDNDIEVRHETVSGSDELVFLYRGHTAVGLWGMCPVRFTNFLHTPQDRYEYIDSRFPGMIPRAMNAFALLLEEFLMSEL